MKPPFYLCLALLFVAPAGCAEKRTNPSDLINQEASLPAGLPFDPLQWRVISSSINRRDATMSILYGNDLAVTQARQPAQASYPAGSVLSLITWTQKDDDHWYGARIPARIKSIEFVEVKSAGPASNVYQDYEGQPLQKAPEKDATTLNERINDILNRRASVMP
jgi:hypothetical protein